jgi:hypothetical protein
MKWAIYARYLSDLQRESAIEDQIRKWRKCARMAPLDGAERLTKVAEKGPVFEVDGEHWISMNENNAIPEFKAFHRIAPFLNSICLDLKGRRSTLSSFSQLLSLHIFEAFVPDSVVC